jgi:hypothetical protein
VNPRTVIVNAKKCAVCDYDMADAHHVYPKRLGGKVTVNLCPNHHRAANLLQLAIATEVNRGTNFDVSNPRHKCRGFSPNCIGRAVQSARLLTDLAHQSAGRLTATLHRYSDVASYRAIALTLKILRTGQF